MVQQDTVMHIKPGPTRFAMRNVDNPLSTLV